MPNRAAPSPLLASSHGTLGPMLRLALPVLAEESLTMLVGYTDWWLVGNFLQTTEHKAAMGLMAYILWLLPSLFAAVAIGATAMVSRFIGAQDAQNASTAASQSFWIGSVLAAAATILVVLGGETFVQLMQLEDQAAQLTLEYLWIVVIAIPFIMIEQVGAACLRGAGDTVSGFVAKSIVNVVNVALSTLLILGPGPIPELGWQGIAVGTACGHIMGGTILLVLLLRGRARLRLTKATLQPNVDMCRRLLRIGIPGGADVLAVLVCHLIYVAIINSLGTLQAAAHGLGVQIEALAYLPGAAFSVAATTMTGQLLGAGTPQRATRGALNTCLVGCSLMTGAAFVFYFGGRLLTTFFTGNPADEAGQLTTELLRIVAYSTPTLGILQILTGALRGAGDTRMPLVFTFIGLLGIRIPVAYLLAVDSLTLPGTNLTVEGFGWGIQGAWWAMVIDVNVRAALVALRFWQGRWKGMKV